MKMGEATKTFLTASAVFFHLLIFPSVADEENSTAHANPLPDGTHVLVKKGLVYGGFELFDQTSSSGDDKENTSFHWWYRVDGDGTYDPDSPEFKSGTSEWEDDRLRFGPFAVQWSMNTKGKGWVYFDKKYTDTVSPEDLRMSVTQLKSFKGIDASDPKIVYGAKPFHFDEPAPAKGVVELRTATPIEIKSIARELTNPKLKDRTPLWRLTTELDEDSIKNLIEAIGASEIPELKEFVQHGKPPIAHSPADIKIAKGEPVKIETRAGIAYIRNHPVTNDRVIELLKKNRINKQNRIEITPRETFHEFFDRDRPRVRGLRLADLLKEEGYKEVVLPKQKK